MPTTERKAGARRKTLSDHLNAVLHEWDRNSCVHENTHRGGTIWTICDDCGMEWADDRGGFTPYQDPPAIADARTALAKARGE